MIFLIIKKLASITIKQNQLDQRNLCNSFRKGHITLVTKAFIASFQTAGKKGRERDEELPIWLCSTMRVTLLRPDPHQQRVTRSWLWRDEKKSIFHAWTEIYPILGGRELASTLCVVLLEISWFSAGLNVNRAVAGGCWQSSTDSISENHCTTQLDWNGKSDQKNSKFLLESATNQLILKAGLKV